MGGIINPSVLLAGGASAAPTVVGEQEKTKAKRSEREQQREQQKASSRFAGEARAERAADRQRNRPRPELDSLLGAERPIVQTGAEGVRLTGAAGVGNRAKIGGQRSLLGVI